uniref:Uncharacterized protein n=1 Tax=Alexandrium catenella TaxID=2925 RepID=A0A7S1RU00_ALECA|mmetsp:Transcript_73109/g.194222  ORF Transcript_73109/g.194222 Transcript_73109/m.194222 type:complete len:692 (+) Transcript_73109:78-2153(+)
MTDFTPPARVKKSAHGLRTEDGQDHFAKAKEEKATAKSAKAVEAKKQMDKIAKEHMDEFVPGVADPDKPFVGAQPKLLREPQIATEDEVARATMVACKAITERIARASGVSIVLAQDSQYSEVTSKLLKDAVDDGTDPDSAPTLVSLGKDWLQTLPRVEKAAVPDSGSRLLIYVGTPGKYMAMCIRSEIKLFDEAYAADRLVVLCKSACMLPLGTQEENIFGLDSEEVLDAIADGLRAKGAIAWAHGAGTKAGYLQKIFGYSSPEAMPAPLDFADDTEGNLVQFDYLVQYVSYLNKVKLAQPELRVTNYYDTGLLVSVLMGCVIEQGNSLLVDRDGLAMLRDASIGHIISKLNQVVAVKPLCQERAVYNFFIGDGACRLNGGVELACHLIEGYHAESLITLFIFNNKKWAIEDNLVADTEKEHALYNEDYYNLLSEHGSVCICENDLELRETIAFLSERTDSYLKGNVKPGLTLVIVRGLDVTMPPVLGNIDPILKSPEMAFMREVLGSFASDCKSPVPIYGCSAFEYIQYLHIFMEQMPEGKKYQYVCGRTDIQAAHMCGFEQPEGKCVLFINDVYGINSLGESLRFVLSGFGGKQLLVMVWHPSLLKVMDHFHLHRPPMVWPSLGPELMKYYVRSDRDAVFVDFEGDMKSHVVPKVLDAIGRKTPVVCVNMMPEQECNYISLDVRLKTG